MYQLKTLNSGKNLNHYAPAKCLLQSENAITYNDQTLLNFEELFKAINKLL